MFRQPLKNLFQKFGYSLKKFHDPVQDISDLLSDQKSPVIFDVGANVGQTALKMQGKFPHAEIYSFEPSPSSFETLTTAVQKLPRVHPLQLGLGKSAGRLAFNQNSNSDMSSFLELGAAGWGEIEKVIEVEVDTVDSFCGKRGIPQIHLLKSDTQGFDLAVLEGAAAMLEKHQIGIIYMEVNFAPLYLGAPGIKDIIGYLEAFGYKIMAIYDLHYLNRVVGWTDVVFLSPLLQERMRALR